MSFKPPCALCALRGYKSKGTAKAAKPAKKKRIPLPLFKTFALSALPAVKPITAKHAKPAKVNKRMCYQDVIQTPLRSLRPLRLNKNS